MGAIEIDPRRWGWEGEWVVESREAALARAPEFGRRFFLAAFDEFKEAVADVRFLSWSEEPEDLYAVFDFPGGGAGVQVDVALEYIIVWGADGPAEYGDWGGADQVTPAVDHLRRLIGCDRQAPENGSSAV